LGLRVTGLLRLRVTQGLLRLGVSLGLLRLWVSLGLCRVGRLLRRVPWLLRRITLLLLRRIPRLLRLRISRLLWVGTRAPGGSRRRAGLPGGLRDGALLIGRDVRRGWTLQRSLAASQQVEEASLVDIEVPRQAGIGPRGVHALAALELPEQIERLARPADATAAGVDEGAALEGIDPVPSRLVQLEHTRLGTVDHLVEEAKQAESINGAERGGRRLLGALLLALGEELHTAVTGDGTPSLPV
jgi:hypothetical protein